MVIGGASMGLQYGSYRRREGRQFSDVYLSIPHSLDISLESFADSTGVIRDSIFSRV